MLQTEYTVYSEITNISMIDEFDGSEKSVRKDFWEINEATVFIVYHPQKFPSFRAIAKMQKSGFWITAVKKVKKAKYAAFLWSKHIMHLPSPDTLSHNNASFPRHPYRSLSPPAVCPHQSPLTHRDNACFLSG